MGEASIAKAKLIRQASSDAKFLRNLTQKAHHHDQEELPSADSFCLSRSQSQSESAKVRYNEQEVYAAYRQKYLVMYSPFREDNHQSEKKQKKHKWFNNVWKKKHNNSNNNNNIAANNILPCLHLF